MPDDVTFGAGNNATPPDLTVAATDETTSGPHAAGAQMGIAKLAVSANGDSTHVPATAADGILVNLGANNDVTVTGSVTTGGLTDAELRAVPVPVSGTVTTGGLTDAELRASAVSVSEERAVTGTVTSVADTASDVLLKASNAARIKILITNDSSARLYVLLDDATASLTVYSVSLAQFETWEEFNYLGEIRGIWATDPGDGAARITEFT